MELCIHGALYPGAAAGIPHLRGHAHSPPGSYTSLRSPYPHALVSLECEDLDLAHHVCVHRFVCPTPTSSYPHL